MPEFPSDPCLKTLRVRGVCCDQSDPARCSALDREPQNSEISGISNASVTDSRCINGSSWIKPRTCGVLPFTNRSSSGFRWQPCKITSIRRAILSCTRSRNRVQRQGHAHGPFIHPAGEKTTAISLTNSGWWLKCCRTINCDL